MSLPDEEAQPADLYRRIGEWIGGAIAWAAIATMVWALVAKWI